MIQNAIFWHLPLGLVEHPHSQHKGRETRRQTSLKSVSSRAERVATAEPIQEEVPQLHTPALGAVPGLLARGATQVPFLLLSKPLICRSCQRI